MSTPVWQARVSAPLDPRARALNDSLAVDQRLWPEELALTRAYTPALAECGVLSAEDAVALLGACDALEADLRSGATTLAGEDVHLGGRGGATRRCGDPARRLHTAQPQRSGRDAAQAARDAAVRERVRALQELERALLVQARNARDLAVAAYTRTRPAQPVLLAHWWLAHIEASERDEERFSAVRGSADRPPLGAGTIAGTPLDYTCVALATASASAGSPRTVSTRSATRFRAQEPAGGNDSAFISSRLGEDLVLWCSPGFGWFGAPTASRPLESRCRRSATPTCSNWRAARGARLIANASQLATLLKGLPSAYQKDLQEDKESVFDSADTLALLLDALPPAIEALEPREDRMRASLTPDLLAVELADALVAEGVPFRDAHAAVGRLWAAAETRGVTPPSCRTMCDCRCQYCSPRTAASLPVRRALNRPITSRAAARTRSQCRSRAPRRASASARARCTSRVPRCCARRRRAGAGPGCGRATARATPRARGRVPNRRPTRRRRTARTAATPATCRSPPRTASRCGARRSPTFRASPP
jgi:argininosuccinate lyase